MKIAIVVSRFNQDITSVLLDGALSCLQEKEIENTVVHVPGAVEIPITVQRLARTKQYDAIITLGAVIFGETKHFDYVCTAVNDGCARVSLDESIPVIFGVLTTMNKEQALARCGGEKGHMGIESVQTAIEMISVLEQIGS